MHPAHRRHDISDKVWAFLELHLSGRKGTRGVTARDNRLFSMPYFGSCAQVLPGETFLQTMEIVKTPIAGFAAGKIRVNGRCCSKFLSQILTLNG